jgi:hypothetical protein
MFASDNKVSRTLLFMSQWIITYAPDVAPGIESGELRVTPTYRALRSQYVMCVVRGLKSRKQTKGMRLEVIRRDGGFVHQWVKDESPSE